MPVSRIADVTTYCLILLDSHHLFYDRGATDARIRPLKQNLPLLISVLVNCPQLVAMREVMKALFQTRRTQMAGAAWARRGRHYGARGADEIRQSEQGRWSKICFISLTCRSDQSGEMGRLVLGRHARAEVNLAPEIQNMGIGWRRSNQ